MVIVESVVKSVQQINLFSLIEDQLVMLLHGKEYVLQYCKGTFSIDTQYLDCSPENDQGRARPQTQV